MFDSVKLFFFLSPTSNFFATNAALHNNIMQATSSQILASKILKTLLIILQNPTYKSYLVTEKQKQNETKQLARPFLKLYSIIQDIFLIKSGRSFHNLGAASLLMYSQI